MARALRSARIGMTATGLALLLSACARPGGAAVEFCGPDWQGVEPVIVTASDVQATAVPIECIRRIGEARVRIGFEMPPGPECHQLAAVEIDEAAESVSLTVMVARVDDPLAGACAPRGTRTTTEVDLQAPIAERQVLDGSR
jgi:hypothetical protein